MFKKIVSYLFTFVLIILILAISAILIVQSTILDKTYVLKVLEETNYYSNTKKNIKDSFDNYILQSGLEEVVIEDLFNEQELKDDINNVINCIYENKTLELNTNNIEQKLRERIDKVLEEHNKRLDKDEEVAIQNFVNAITEAYTNEVAYSEKAVTQIGNVLNNQIKPLLFVGLITACISLAIILLIMLIMNKSKIFNYIGIASVASGVTLGIIPIGIRMKVKIDTLLMFNNSFSNTLAKLIDNTLNITLWVSAIIAIVGVCILVISSMLETRKKEI